MLEVNSLSVSYGNRRVINNVSLSVNAGEILVVIGPNGAGKSTLIRAISGTLGRENGSVKVGGKEINRMNAAQRASQIAVVPQARNLPGAFTVYQSVLLGRTPYLGWMGMAGEHDRLLVQSALERTSCVDLAELPVGQLSGGEQQRVLLARALAQNTPVLLLDEPTTHLDLQHQSGLLNLVRELACRNNQAILMVVHDLNLASVYADRVALLDSGQIITVGTPNKVLTEEKLTAVYRVPVHVIPHPNYNTPLVLPDGRIGTGR